MEYFLLLSFAKVKDPWSKNICRQRLRHGETRTSGSLDYRRTKLVNLKSIWKQWQNVCVNKRTIHTA